jgi:N-acetylglucosamine-6-sulfatase
MDLGEPFTRRTLLGTAAIAALAARGLASPDHARAAGTPPNVLWIITDDQMRSTLPYMPRVGRRLVRRGVRFRRGYAAVPLCGPARASMLSGMYAHNHQCLTNGTHSDFVAQGLDQDTVATRMKAAGYDTGYFGKYMNGMHGAESNRVYVAPGWDRWVNRLVDQDFCVDGVVTTVKGRVDQYSADGCRRFIEDRSDRPWFAVFAPRNPHNDWNLEYHPTRAHAHDFDGVRWDPPAFNEKNMADKPSFYQNLRFRGRKGMRAAWEGKLELLQETDDHIEQILDALVATNQLARTFIFLVSDNGFMLGEHRMFDKGKAYEESSGIPFVVRGPGVSAGPRGALVSQVDLMPTTLAIAGLDPDAGRALDGRSMLGPLRTGDWSGWRRRLLVEHPHRNWAMLRERTLTFVDHYERGEQELYDLATDPYQMRSRARGTDTSVMTARLTALRTAAGVGLRELEAAP